MSQNLKNIVYAKLKKDIITNKIKPGTQLLATKLADEFSVSRTPVREAMGILEKDGLVKLLPKNGYLVKDISYREMLDTYYVRILLEKEAAKLAAERILPEQIEELNKNCIYYEEDHIWDNNKKFHMIIARAAGNYKLIDFLEQTIEQIDRFIMLDPYMNLKDSIGKEEHYQVIDALEAGDGEKASMLMEKHLIKTRERIHKEILAGKKL